MFRSVSYKEKHRIHKNNCHNKSKRETIYPECGYVVIGGAGVLRQHMRKQEIKEQCPGCSKLVQKRSMARHQKTCRPPVPKPEAP